MPVRKTVLLVDNNKNVMHYLGTVLKRMGFGVETAESGRAALKFLKQARPDLVLVQSKMSWYSGYDTLKAIRKDSRYYRMPVVIMYDEIDDKLKRRCVEAGASEFLSMPIRMDELHEILQKFVMSTLGFRRKHMRVNAGMKVMVYNDGRPGMYNTVVVSEGGLYIRTDKPLTVLSEVEVSLAAPDRDLKLKGLVIYQGGFGSDKAVPPGMAVEFIGLGAQDAASMKMLVNRLMTGDMARESHSALQHQYAAG